MLKEGDSSKDFALEGAGGKGRGTRRLSDARGKYAVVYFYPRDNTPGCTREAQAFSKARAAFEKAGAVVYGISKDSIASHEKFVGHCDLTIDLLSDPDLAVHKAYGAYGEKTMYGKKVLGVIRSTFLVDPKGKIARVFPSVKVDGHPEKVLEALREHQGTLGDTPKPPSGAAAKAKRGKR
jgi:peroxiredoxin Q/BCP